MKKPTLCPSHRAAAALLVASLLGCGPEQPPSDAPGSGTLASHQGALTVSPTPIPFSEAEIVNPMRGYFKWSTTETVPQPRLAMDHYTRLTWRWMALHAARPSCPSRWPLASDTGWSWT